MEEILLMWFSVWVLHEPLNMENEKAEVAMIRGVPCWLLYECIQMCVYMCTSMASTYSWAAKGKHSRTRTVYHLHCLGNNCQCWCVLPGEAKLTFLVLCSVTLCVCVCIYVIMCEVLTLADVWPQWSQTCVRGQDEGSSYINTPREIECERALGPVGPRD